MKAINFVRPVRVILQTREDIWFLFHRKEHFLTFQVWRPNVEVVKSRHIPKSFMEQFGVASGLHLLLRVFELFIIFDRTRFY